MTNHPVTDEFIAQRWPEIDTPEGREEIRREFDALMEQIRNAAWKPFPRFHDHMASIVVEKSRTLPDRLNNLKAALAGIPPHLLKYQWKADERPHFGNKSVRVEPTDVVGDDGHGFGRQWIARVNHVSKNYVGTLADFIAAANPDTVGMMIARIEYLESLVAERTLDSAEAHRMRTIALDIQEGYIQLSKAHELAPTIAGFERDYPELYWHVAKGKVSAGEPLYGAIITDNRGTELGHGESDMSALTAFRAALANAKLPAAYIEQDIATLEAHLKNLIAEHPAMAALATSYQDQRMWFVAKLTSIASGRVPLTKIEALVTQALSPTKGDPRPN
ncbi:hypothetical protein L905_21725 [Agrobacterium sp. TS43]|uniref:hypothetical protein n=1 Tax=Agrobacterium TaxID=357 RepID=UPI00036207F2|nr:MULTISPECIES: hypothetical protein [Agrobacterium]EPR19728.1 hypothetical protein L902_10445 [Agrobacterium radiobacter DSM 30147]KDR87250.1 hypothetical protein K538_28695 [Agrobacterium tumefaciens GW4]KVK45107.1 hypothetical protein L904_26450 [Agrobacterium sp. LY4]KVK45147.1 hypothetical protein L903_26370 [Agrobacterium sp. JL28]KVK58503.1 hypothetical protein L906_26285 [Agrobacterium sp. TS45]